MSTKFMEELQLKADITTELKGMHPSDQMAEMMKFLTKNLDKDETELAVVVGDTNSAFVGAFAALKAGIRPVHVESGLRSYDWRMSEEHNRILCDHISEILFAPTKHNRATLLGEHVHGKIHVTGNTVIDAVKQNITKALKDFCIDIPDDYILLTLHRAENVDDKSVLEAIVKSMLSIKEKIVFPVHPRTLKRLKQFNLYDRIANSGTIKLIDPAGYFDFLALMKKSRIVITDSGGVQEECTAPDISKFVVVLRKSTERVESVEMGYSTVSKLTPSSIVSTVRRRLKEEPLSIRKSPYGDGKSGKRIARILSAEK